MSDAGAAIAGVAIGYLIGTFPSADLIGRLATRGRIDIRAEGSGNPGGLNSMRVLGRGWGVAVIVLDAAKGTLAGFLGLLIGDTAACAAGTAAMAGHVWPVWSHFRGGRGVATAGGSFATVFPPFFVIGAVVAGVTAVVTRSASTAVRTVAPVWIAAAALWWAAGLSNWWGPDAGIGLLLYAVAGAAIVLSQFRSAVRPASGPSL